MTPPLSEDFTSDADWLLPLIDLVWSASSTPDFKLYDWQRTLIRHMLETYPPGHPRAGTLRYRQILCSLGRQNGKSVIGAVLGLWGLLRQPGATVIGIASNIDQANIIYNRVMEVILNSSDLAKAFHVTGTRGITGRDNSTYKVVAAKSASLQGIPITTALIDEAHLLKTDLYQALVNGTGGRPNTCVIAVTTAGDENSELLKDLYKYGQKAVGGHKDFKRFGYFCWEAEESRVPEDDETLIKYLKQANPTMAEGHADMEAIVSDVRAQPEIDVIRYRLNRFVASVSSFMTLEDWNSCRISSADKFPEGRPVFTIDRTPSWGYASITASIKDKDGLLYTELVASIVNPDNDQLVRICLDLCRHNPLAFVADNYALPDLIKELKKRGKKVIGATKTDVSNASSLLYSKLKQKRIRHAGDPLLSLQIPFTKRQAQGDSFRISRKESSKEIDAVMATALGIYIADTFKEAPLQLF